MRVDHTFPSPTVARNCRRSLQFTSVLSMFIITEADGSSDGFSIPVSSRAHTVPW